MIRYLKNTGSSTAVDLTELILKSPSFANVVTISNTASSINTVTGALIVAGGVGVSGNINAGENISTSGNIKAFNGEFINNVSVQGYTTSNYVNVPGILTASLGEFNYINGNSLNITGQTITSALEVINNGNFGSITSTSGVIEDLTSTTISGVSELTTTKANVNDLYVDNIYPNSSSQINLGNVSNIKIDGGSYNQVLGTDGNGNLTWLPGTGAISVGTGLRRDGDVISLSGTGFEAGTFNQVTIDQYGRVVSATNFINNLQDVTNRGALTTNSISITNETESVDTTTGALTVTGGVGISGTLNVQNLAVASTVEFSENLNVAGQTNFSGTVNFNSTQVPIKISSGTLVSSPSLGTLEFDGTSLYITTNVGRQLVQLKNSELSAATTFIARASAARNINIANGNQYTADGEDNWDDVILEIRNVVLLTKQTNPAENGLYIWNTENSPLTRHPDFNTLSTIRQGTIIFVSEGIENGGSFYKVTTPDPINIGITQLSISQHFNADNIALSSLPKNSAAGLLVRTQYGSIALREIQTNSSWLTITNPTGFNGNIIITSTTVPVSAGGTGRTSITGWMKGLGGSIQSTPLIPLADIDGAGTIASQNANNVSIIGGTIDNVTIGESTAASAQFTNITVNSTKTYSTYFDGVGDYLKISNPPVSLRKWDEPAFTMEMWVYIDSFATERSLIGHLVPDVASSWTTFFWAFAITTTRALKFSFQNTAGNGRSITSNAVFNLSQWHHIAFVKDDTLEKSISFFVDGVQVISTTFGSNNTAAHSASAPIVIGQANLSSSAYQGYITNLRVTTSVVYTSNFTPPISALLPLPGTVLLTCQSSTIVDRSTNALTITANGDVQTSTLNPFASGISFETLVLNNYSTGLVRVVGDSSFDGVLQVSGEIYKNGFEVLNNTDIIDGGTY